jgi:hypothetical protein
VRVWNYYTDTPSPGALFVTRKTIFGNPFVIGRDGTRDEVCDKFEEWFPKQEELVAQAKKYLKGRDLVCCCAPLRCHATTLMRIANE